MGAGSTIPVWFRRTELEKQQSKTSARLAYLNRLLLAGVFLSFCFLAICIAFDWNTPPATPGELQVLELLREKNPALARQVEYAIDPPRVLGIFSQAQATGLLLFAITLGTTLYYFSDEKRRLVASQRELAEAINSLS